MMTKINENVWQNYDTSNLIEVKLAMLKQWIPESVSSILDVGCGNGIISNALAEDYDVTGVDISETALSYVTTKKLLASATSIPLPDKSFDLVFSSEMLEHLTDEELLLATREMSRLAKQYLIISVPNQEQLSKSFVQCKSCARVYHAYGHLHSFNTHFLASFFPQFVALKQHRFGPSDPGYHPALLWIKNKLAGQYFHPDCPVTCPGCKSEEFVRVSNPLSKACNFLNAKLSKPHPYWLMLLFKRIEGKDI